MIQWNGRQGEAVALHAERLRYRRRSRHEPQGSRRQHQRRDGLHRRRLRQQVRPGDRGASKSAHLSQKAGGKPVKLFLDRATELTIAGNRPSAFAKIKVAAKKDGTITAWQSRFLGHRRLRRRRQPAPAVRLHQHPEPADESHGGLGQRGPARAWRAPNNQQAAYLTCCALEDLAAKLGMDPMEVFDKNAGFTRAPEIYRYQLRKGRRADGLEEEVASARRQAVRTDQARSWPCASTRGAARGHASKCRTTINPDGSVVVELGTQDLGTGTRTVITMVAAETLGLPLSADQIA